MPSLLLTTCVTVSRSLSLSELRAPHLCTEKIIPNPQGRHEIMP